MKISVRQLKFFIKEQIEEQWKQHTAYGEPESTPEVSNDTDTAFLREWLVKHAIVSRILKMN